MNVECVGLSKDGRANVWRVTCRCGKTFEPTDTMLRWQTFDCPKCGKTYSADWNEPCVWEAA